MIANGLLAHARLSATACGGWVTYLFFSLPRGMTAVTGGMGRSEPPLSLGSEVSFLGFFAILLLRCSPLAIVPPVKVSGWDRSAGWYATTRGAGMASQALLSRCARGAAGCPSAPWLRGGGTRAYTAAAATTAGGSTSTSMPSSAKRG